MKGGKDVPKMTLFKGAVGTKSNTDCDYHTVKKRKLEADVSRLTETDWTEAINFLQIEQFSSRQGQNFHFLKPYFYLKQRCSRSGEVAGGDQEGEEQFRVSGEGGGAPAGHCQVVVPDQGRRARCVT